MKITIGGDFCITPDFISNDLFDQSVIDLFKSSDYNIVNLECPVTDDNSINKILKTGPHLRTDEGIISHLKQLNINAVTLASNHLLDYGQIGLIDTFEFCEKNNIEFIGAGLNLSAAQKFLRIEKDEKKVAILNFCENEWSIATSSEGGANPLDIIDNINQIKLAKANADFVIVIIHGGNEYIQLPSPRMVKQYHFYADNGADVIVGHHTHCVSGYELYNNVPIFYSLGNLIFTKNNRLKVWYDGLLLQLQIHKDKPVGFQLLPVRQVENKFKLKLLAAEEKIKLMGEIAILSDIITDPIRLKSEWELVIQSKEDSINQFLLISNLSGRYLQAVFRKIGLYKLLLNRTFLKKILNYIRCESHREALIENINKKLK